MNISDQGRVLLFVLVGACGKEEAAGPSGSTTAPAASSAGRSAAPRIDLDDEAADLCQSIDRDALAKALGIDGLSKMPSSTIKGGGGPVTRSCSFFEEGKFDGGLGVDINFVSDPTLEARDILGRFDWKPFEGLGAAAAIGRAENAIHLQSVAHGVRVDLSVSRPRTPGAELEPTAVAAMKTLLAGVPADAAAQLAK